MNTAKKKIFKGFTFFFILVAVILVLLHTRPVRVQILRFLESSLEKKQGLRLTARSLNYNLLSLRIKLANVSLSGIGKDNMPVFLEAEEIKVHLPLAIFFKKGIILSSLMIKHPRLNYYIGINGEKNIPFRPRAEAHMPNFRIKRMNIEEAHIRYKDKTRQLGGELTGVGIQAHWIKEKGHSAQIHMGNGGSILYKDIEYGLNELLVMGQIDESHVDFDRIELNVSNSQFEFSGGLSDFTRMAVSGDVNVKLDMEDLRKIFPEMGAISGRLNLEGEVEGPLKKPTAQLSLNGKIQSFHNLEDFFVAAEAIWKDNRLTISPLELSSPQGRLMGTASLSPLDWKQGNRIDLEWASLDLDSFDFIFGQIRQFSSKTSGTLQATWSDLNLESVEARAEISVFPSELTNISPEKIPVSGLFHIDLSAGKVFLAADELRLPGAWGEARIQVDRDSLGGEWRVESREPAAILPSLSRFFGNIDLRTLSQLSLDGSLQIQGDVGGSVRSPVVQAELSCEDFVFYGERFDNVDLSLSFKDNKIEMKSLVASKSDGLINASGWFDLLTKEYASQFSVESLMIDRWRPPGDITETKIVVDLSGKSQGTLQKPQILAEGVLSGFALGDLETEDLRVRANMKEKRINFELDIPVLTGRANGVLLLEPPFRLEAAVDVEDLPIQNLSSLYPVSLAKTLSGNLAAQLNVSVNLAQPADTWTIRANIGRFLLDSGLFQIHNVQPIEFTADSKVLNVGNFKIEGIGLNIEGKGSLFLGEKGGQSNLTARADVDLALLSDLFPGFSAGGSLKVDSRFQGGSVRDSSLNASLTLSEGRIEFARFPEVIKNLGIQLEVKDNQIQIQSCVFELGDAGFSIEGKVPFQSLPVSLPFLSAAQENKQLKLWVGLKNLKTSLLNAFLRDKAVQNVEGNMNADILIQGTKLQWPLISAAMKTESFVLKVADLHMEPDKPIEVHLDQGRVIVSPFLLSGPDSLLKVGGSIDLMGSKEVDFDMEGELDFSVIQEVVKDFQTRGTCSFDFRITGTSASPEFGGSMRVQNAELSFGPPRFVLENFNGQIQFEDSRLVLKDLGGQLNGGKMAMEGEIGLEGWSISNGKITIMTEDVLFDISRSLRSQVSSDLKFSFSADEKIISGTVDIHYGQYSEDINLESSFFRALRRGFPSRTFVKGDNPWLGNLQWQVGVNSLNPVLIENNLLNAQISAAVNLTGTFRQPGLTGRLESLEGGKLYFGKNIFLIKQATVDFINPRRIEPDLNVTAMAKVGEFEITLTLSGTPDKLSASLTSEPALTEPNIVSLLVTGVTLEGSASSLFNVTGNEALSYLNSVLTGRLESVLENSFGLDNVRIDTGLISGLENPLARITLQQHLSRNLEMMYSQNLQAARNRLWVLDYNPVPNVNIQGVKQDNNELSLFFRHEVSFGLKPLKTTMVKRKRISVGDVVLEGSPVFSWREITNRFHLRTGSRYDHFKLSDGLDRLRNMYSRHLFLNSSISSVRTEVNGKMQIALRILAGPKVFIEFSGDSVPGKIKKETSDLWTKTPYDRLAILLIEERLQQYFIEKRYFQVDVNHQEPTEKDGEKRVVFKIAKGLKYKKPVLLFEGNRSIPGKQLEELIKHRPDFHLLFIDPRAAVRRVKDFYIRNGFLQAFLDKPAIKYFPEEEMLTVTFVIREGPRYKIGDLALEGNVFFDATELEDILNIRKDDIYRRDDVEKAVFSLEEAYARKGFNQVELDVLTQEDVEKETVDLAVKIQENMQGNAGEIRISGNSITSEKVISRELELHIGDLMDHRLLNKARKRLYDLGIFKRVQIEAVPLEPSSVTLQPYRIDVEVVELQPYRLRYGLQYDTETSLGVSSELINRNLFGRSMLVGASFRLNRDEKDLKAFYRSPYFLAKKISTEFFVSYNTSEKPSFSLDRSGLTIQQQTKLGRFSILSYSYSFERVWTLFSETALDSDTADTVHHEGMLNLAFSRDTRDSIMNASRGLFLSQYFGYAAKWLGSEVRFLRYFGELYTYHKISGSFIYAFAFRLGLGQGLESDLSLSQRFFAGGGTTIRGFKKNEVGPKNPETGLAQGGDAVVILNHELRFSLSKKWSAAVFLDLGNVYSRVSDIAPFNLREAAGFGIRYHTRFILIRMDWGFKLDRRPGESLSRIFFSIGQVF